MLWKLKFSQFFFNFSKCDNGGSRKIIIRISIEKRGDKKMSIEKNYCDCTTLVPKTETNAPTDSKQVRQKFC